VKTEEVRNENLIFQQLSNRNCLSVSRVSQVGDLQAAHVGCPLDSFSSTFCPSHGREHRRHGLDAGWAVLPNACVTIVNEGTDVTRRVSTDSKGDYQAADLNPGTYTVRVEAAGFSEFRSTGVVVAAQPRVRIDVDLKMGTTNATVTVNAGAPVIQTDMPSIASTRLRNAGKYFLQLVEHFRRNRRQRIIVLHFTPAWRFPGRQLIQLVYVWFPRRGRVLQRGRHQFKFSSLWQYGRTFSAAVGMIQEVAYSAVDNKAELGQLLNISVITQSGTNKFHGDLFDNYANSALDARNYFSNSLGRLIQNDFGANIGGPILRDKWFFFASGEFLRQAQPISINPSVPIMAMRAGDLGRVHTNVIYLM
jgi:Carboxypeptidase regulatory-like domain